MISGFELESEKSKGGQASADEQGHETRYHHRKRCADPEETG